MINDISKNKTGEMIYQIILFFKGVFCFFKNLFRDKN